ncbi:hypothetical protein [Cryobacterium sp. Y62]|uniref:hypothetical protein n=1 Tax=Cryobacterium sp. Y62 TaxID=2048284 RepID=UPI0011B024EF|nr:hypothetical protein [Cryobacterium sp. Y62]
MTNVPKGSVDLTAPVERFEVGQLVRWQYGDKVKTGTIVRMRTDDARYCDEEGSPYAPWGTYFGRLCEVECDQRKCFCRKPQEGELLTYHLCNECQFTDASTLVEASAGMLF